MVVGRRVSSGVSPSLFSTHLIVGTKYQQVTRYVGRIGYPTTVLFICTYGFVLVHKYLLFFFRTYLSE